MIVALNIVGKHTSRGVSKPMAVVVNDSPATHQNKLSPQEPYDQDHEKVPATTKRRRHRKFFDACINVVALG